MLRRAALLASVFREAGIFIDTPLRMQQQRTEVRTHALGILKQDLPGEALPLSKEYVVKRLPRGAWRCRHKWEEPQCMLKELPDPVAKRC